MRATISLLAVAVLAACGGKGGGAAGDMAGVADLSKADGACARNPESLCGQPCDRGNSLGVGRYCAIQDDCAEVVGGICSRIQPAKMAWFCTTVCAKDGDCGEKARCVCDAMAGGCGCTPEGCLPPPDGSSGN